MSVRSSWVGYGAVLWALIFAALHVVWASGWYVGLNPETARLAFQKRWFLVYDLIVAAICAVATVVALALVQPWGRRLRRGLIGGIAWCGTAILALRGGAGAGQTVYFAATGRDVSARSTFVEAWFCLGAALFALSTVRFWRGSPPPFDGDGS